MSYTSYNSSFCIHFIIRKLLEDCVLSGIRIHFKSTYNIYILYTDFKMYPIHITPRGGLSPEKLTYYKLLHFIYAFCLKALKAYLFLLINIFYRSYYFPLFYKNLVLSENSSLSFLKLFYPNLSIQRK